MEFKAHRFIFFMAFCWTVYGQSLSTSQCSISDVKEISISIKSCHKEALQHVDSSSDFNKVCRAADQMVKCGDFYKTCFSGKELRDQLDAQLEVFISYMESFIASEVDFQSCSTVKEYKQSGRSNEWDPTEKCTSEKMEELETKSDECFEKGNIAAKKQIGGGHFRGEALIEIANKTANALMEKCGTFLSECYSDEEYSLIIELSGMREILVLGLTKHSVAKIGQGEQSSSTSLGSSLNLAFLMAFVLFLNNKPLALF